MCHRRASPPPVARCAAAVAALLVCGGGLASQPPPATRDPAAQELATQDPAVQSPAAVQSEHERLEGKIVRDVRFPGATSPQSLSDIVQTRRGQPLHAAEVAADLQTLWRRNKIGAKVIVEETTDGGVIVVFEVVEPESYDRIVFKGLNKFTEVEVRDLLGLTLANRVTDADVDDHRRVLEERYSREGFLYAHVRVEKDREVKMLTYLVDEGPKVTVREVHFRGNLAFPGDAPLDMYRNLIGGAEIESKPAGWLLPGSPFSREVLDDDLEKLRLFYRARGYRDADVVLAAVDPSEDLSEVDLTFRVIEGARYRIRSVDVVRLGPSGQPDPSPLYSKAELISRFDAKPGDYYDRELINHDKREIVEFYGERGHPLQGLYGRVPLRSAFEWVGEDWMQPQESFDPVTAEIDVVYQIREGTPKTLHDVLIRGNTDTRDQIVRRKVLVYPGEPLDLTEVNRSLRILDSLRYFQDPDTLAGVRFELLPVEGDDDRVDLRVDVQEGDTGSFLWGAGVSTGAGVQGRIQFNKRNFDWTRGPSSFNPATMISEIISNKAFHGGGQELEMLFAPGTEITTARVSYYQPDLFDSHIDTIGMRLQAFRSIRILDSFDSDSRGGIIGLQRNFTENVSLGLEARQETVQVEDIDGNAPGIVFDAEGQTEVRSLRVSAAFRDLDHFLQPTDGYDVRLSAEVAGGLFGAEEDFYKLSASGSYYHTLHRDSLDRPHVLFVRQSFDFGHAFGNTDDLFLTERFYMGGNNLRGFDQRRAGPTQFGRPLGGEVRYLSRFEYQYPLVSTRLENAIREVELLRGVVFTDAGLLGTSFHDRSFGELRLSVGAGVRIHVPILGVPIALDLGFPLLHEETDDRQIFFFSLSSR